MASYAHNTSSNKSKPWPVYFIVRTSGEVVPLIGVDELPIGTDLVGVPRALDLEDTIGMLNLGVQRSSEALYQIAPSEGKKADIADTAAKLAALELETKPKAAEVQQSTSAHSSARSTTTAASNSPPTHQSLRTSTSRILSETQICRHWCTHGICKWGQQCRYRHIMPMTLPGLHEIGLNDWPQWYRALNPGYFASEVAPLTPNFGRRGKGRTCTSKGCCGGMNLGVGVTRARAERLRAAARAERIRKEDLGEQTLARLKGLPKKGKVVEEQGLISGTVMLERAAVKDAKDWEEEGSEVAEESKENAVEGKEESVAKTSLLD